MGTLDLLPRPPPSAHRHSLENRKHLRKGGEKIGVAPAAGVWNPSSGTDCRTREGVSGVCAVALRM